MHWAEAELIHQAARELEAAMELDPRNRDHLAKLADYRNWLIVCAAVSGAEDADIARAAGITRQDIRNVIEQNQTREERDGDARRSA